MNTGFLGPAVATVLTVYGIETFISMTIISKNQLQQYLPFTVLKRSIRASSASNTIRLQQYLPFTVLKLLSGLDFLC